MDARGFIDFDFAALAGEHGERAQTVLDVIRNRRSIRVYQPDPISDEHIALLIEAARWAPTGEDANPWRFIIIRDRETIQKIGRLSGLCDRRVFTAEYLSGEMEKRLGHLDEEKRKKIEQKLISGKVSSFVMNAPLLMVLCGRRDLGWDMPYDCSACVQNILLMAQAIGLASCWVESAMMDIRDETAIRRMLDVPKNYRPFTAITIGYPAQVRKPRPRLPHEEIVYYERFGRRENGA